MALKSVSLATTALVISASVNATTLSFNLDGLTGEYTPNTGGFENAGGKKVDFNIGQSLDLVVSQQLEIHGIFSSPIYKDNDNNIYEIDVNFNGGLGFDRSDGNTFGVSWGHGLGSESITSPPDFDIRFDYAINNDGSFYFSQISNVGDAYSFDLFATGGASSHVVFYLPEIYFLQDDPRYADIWDQLTLVSAGSVTVDSVKASISNEIKFEPNIPSIPIPSAVWLFGSGLIGLIGMARRKA